MKRKRFGSLVVMALTLIMVFATVISPLGAKKALAASEAPAYRNVMYYGEWSIYSGQKNFYPGKIDGSQITHLNFAFLDMDSNGDLVLCDEHADFLAILPEQTGLTYGEPYAGVLGAMSILRTKYPNMKIGVSVGGWTRSGDFSAVAASADKRAHFAKNIAKFVDYLGFDFVDIDWEYPTAVRESDPAGNGVTIDEGCPGSEADTVNFTKLLQAIRDELRKLGDANQKYYELSVAMSASPSMMSKIEYDKVLGIVDFANMMTYDLNGAWNSYTGHQTALYTNPAYDPVNQKDGAYSVDACVQYLRNTYGNSIDYSKIVIGVAPYTRGWAGVQSDGRDAANPGLYATAEPNSVRADDGVMSGTFAYGDIESLKAKYQLNEYYDEVAQAAYYYSPSTGYFFTCDNERSVAAKGQYVKENGLGGLISWMASLDSANSITRTMKESLYGNAPLPVQDIKTGDIKAEVSVSASGNTYTFTIKNNELASENNTALKDAELFKKTVMFPKLYISTKSGNTLSAGSECGQVSTKGDVTVVDLSGVYAAKSMKPGSSHTFTLRTSGDADVNDIEGITMTQRILTSLDEFGTQSVYGAGSSATPGSDPEGNDDQHEGTTPDTEIGDDDNQHEGTTPENHYTDNGLLPQHMVTGYWHNFINGSANLKLSDVPSYYDMICVAFTDNTSVPGEVTFSLDDDLSRALGGYSKSEFISDIAALKEKGQHVIISVGGAEGRITINSAEAADRFANGLISIIEEYGFEGVDIDLEGSAVSGVDYIASALRKVHDHFGDGFIITMAPETFYIQAGRLANNDYTTSYLRLALQIKDILTVCYPQFYNSGSMVGYNDVIVNPGTADFITSLSTLIIEAGLRPDQVAVGVPSTSGAAGSGYVTPSVLEGAVNALVNGTSSGTFTAPRSYPTLRGVMTWSINWDATNNYEWGRAMAAAMDRIPVVENDGTITDPGTGSGTGSDEGGTTDPGIGDSTDPGLGDNTDPDAGSGTGPDAPSGSYPEWNATQVYLAGDMVSYGGKIYRAAWWTQGDNPESQGQWGPWKLVGNNPGVGAGSGGNTGSGLDAGSDAGGTSGPATGDATNPPAGDTGTPDTSLGSYPEWNATQVYVAGDMVSYGGKVYKAAWWTQGDNPESQGAWGPWKIQ
ncbi:glycosyl hydrolase family 18 protein [Butyrivibrio sp. MC2013]|uniref:glycosyl hydrolase family 18 protein n=1 Tax=Butyrivibrio sp. MC2013 TaxID=1280686 RepID=UPI00040A0C7B|nr:glycosyl hydrolase family 18 protein [Butyrivibrio sp. MC2013]